jgi:Fe-S-cluster containining protein
MLKALKENVGKSTSLIRTGDKWTEKDDRAEFQCLFRDTATSRVIAVRIIESRGQMHQVSVPYDTVHGMPSYSKKFFESLEPIDSAGINSMFDSHFKELLQTLKGSDSTKREVALNALSEITYNKSYSKDFIDYVSDKSFNNLNENIKSAVLSRGGYIGDPAIIPLYKQLYQQYTDSFYLQLSVLKGLARLRLAEGHKALGQLLAANPILIGDEDVLNDFFAVVKDSIELCKQLYPEVLTLCRYEEYRPAVCDMFADLTPKQTLTAKEKTDLLLDANLALKRQAQNTAQNGERGKLNDYTEILKYNGYVEYNQGDDDYYAGVRPLLLSYVKMFAPYYGKDPAVTTFFIKLWKQKDNEYLVPSAVEILKYSPKAIDSLVTVCMNNEKLLAPLVIQAKVDKVDSLLPLAKINQQQLNRSFLLNKEIGIESGKANDKNSKDSLQFLKTIDIKNRYQNGTMYFYKRQVLGTPRWAILFVQKSKKEVSANIELIDGSYRYDLEKTEEKNTAEVTDWFMKRYHKRTGGGYR